MTITIVGIGLIGGSIAIDLKENGFADEIIGVDINQENLDKALRRRIIDRDSSMKEAIAASEVIIVAVPADKLMTVVPSILDQVEQQVVIEVGSTKERLLQSLATHPKRHRLVATHPMAGTEYAGPEAALPRLFDDKCCVFCDKNASDVDAWDIATALFTSLNMRIANYQPKAHDLHAAYVSHISHISSFALALTVLAKEKDEDSIFEMASGGFSSSVRLAKSSASMWVPILEQNRDNVLDVLDEHINSLAKFRSLLIKNDFVGITALINQSNHIKKIIG